MFSITNLSKIAYTVFFVKISSAVKKIANLVYAFRGVEPSIIEISVPNQDRKMQNLCVIKSNLISHFCPKLHTLDFLFKRQIIVP